MRAITQVEHSLSGTSEGVCNPAVMDRQQFLGFLDELRDAADILANFA